MHSFIKSNFVIESPFRQLSKAESYRGKRASSNQDVLIFDFVLSSLNNIEKAVNQLIKSLVATTQGEQKVTDCHVDLAKNHIIFAILESHIEFADNFIKSNTEIEHNDADNVSLRLLGSRRLTKIKIPRKNGDDTPENTEEDEGDHDSKMKFDPKLMRTTTDFGSRPDNEDSPLLDIRPKPRYSFANHKTQTPIQGSKSERSISNFYSADSRQKEQFFTEETPRPVGLSGEHSYEPPTQKILSLLDEDVSHWKLSVTEKDKKVYVKIEEGSTIMVVRVEALIPNADSDILAQMHIDNKIRREWDTSFCNISCPGIISAREDILYQEYKMPFPISNRDFLLYRYHLCNEKNPEEVEDKGLWNKPNKYWILMLNSIQDDAHPIKKGLTRAHIFTGQVFEQDPQNPDNVIYRMVSQVDMRGHLPSWVINQACGKGTAKVVDDMVKAYRKNANRWKKTQ